VWDVPAHSFITEEMSGEEEVGRRLHMTLQRKADADNKGDEKGQDGIINVCHLSRSATLSQSTEWGIGGTATATPETRVLLAFHQILLMTVSLGNFTSS
jgi:hypothetical protein